MARRSLRPQLNLIRTWVRQGRTDAWIAHQLEVSAAELQEFKRQHDLADATADDAEGADDLDLRDQIEAEVEAASLREEEEAAAREAKEAARREAEEAAASEAREARGEQEEDGPAEGAEGADEAEPDSEGGPKRRRRRRGGRGRGRGKGPTTFEGTFDHGADDGYGLWLDPSVQDSSVYAEHWAGHRPVKVTIEPERIVIERVETDDEA